ncbi:MAG: bifunctional DNA-formamidopyrimidine glycosylase/DNA-(apurinic or apyrimidinic site) lyase [Actinomycetota bacterium]|nr:bifunctional DNA-formamidopyrimidine glycosylase/DNA-(apurinic or apyrimidinic site) lyase [Actinomycetota bacterium]
MPELPEVEVVRRGLERGVVGRRVARVEVHHPRAVRRHVPGEDDFRALLEGRTLDSAQRRGKYLWLPLDSGDALTGHLGMSGQLLVVPPDKPAETHLRVRFAFTDGGRELRFVDQRTFGGLAVVAGGAELPSTIAHVARDPLDPAFDDDAFVAGLRAKRTGLKRALLDQTLVSGIGNIYADESLWRARLHGERATERLTRPQARALLGHVRDVLRESLAQGGTSFDALYVSVDGVSGLFERSLSAYGREGEPCPRCGTPLRREAFMGRSSFSCPRCQPRPRATSPSPSPASPRARR